MSANDLLDVPVIFGQEDDYGSEGEEPNQQQINTGPRNGAGEEFRVPNTQTHINGTAAQLLANESIAQQNQEENVDDPVGEEIEVPQQVTITPDELFKQLKNERRQERATMAVQDPDNVNQERENIFQTPEVYQYPFDRPGLEKPWLEREKAEEYFNYGFNEETFKIYQQKINLFTEKHLPELKQDKDYDDIVLQDNGSKHHHPINFYLPHEFGGSGQPCTNLYSKFNVYKPEDDLAIIKPVWTQRHDFQVDLPQNKDLGVLEDSDNEDDVEKPDKKQTYAIPSLKMTNQMSSIATNEQQLKYAQKFEKTILKEWELNSLPELKEQIAKKQKILEEEKKRFEQVERQKKREYDDIERREKKLAIDKQQKRREQKQKDKNGTHRDSRERDYKGQGRYRDEHRPKDRHHGRDDKSPREQSPRGRKDREQKDQQNRQKKKYHDGSSKSSANLNNDDRGHNERQEHRRRSRTRSHDRRNQKDHNEKPRPTPKHEEKDSRQPPAATHDKDTRDKVRSEKHDNGGREVRQERGRDHHRREGGSGKVNHGGENLSNHSKKSDKNQQDRHEKRSDTRRNRDEAAQGSKTEKRGGDRRDGDHPGEKPNMAKQLRNIINEGLGSQGFKEEQKRGGHDSKNDQKFGQTGSYKTSDSHSPHSGGQNRSRQDRDRKNKRGDFAQPGKGIGFINNYLQPHEKVSEKDKSRTNDKNKNRNGRK